MSRYYDEEYYPIHGDDKWDDENQFSDYYSDQEDILDNQPEMGAFGPNGRVGGFSGVVQVPKNRKEQAMLDPVERFRLYVDSTARNLNHLDNRNLDNQSIEEMLRNVDKLTDVKHKNPTAYVLGFLATGGGQKLTKRDFNNVIQKILPSAREGSVLAPDVIRYARLWENFS
jgi:Family of unknown function (DUF5770)